MKKILPKIFAAWALLVFTLTIIPVAFIMWIIGLLKEPRRTKVFRQISKVWMQLFFLLSGCSLKVFGKENLKRGEIYIITCNHRSFMDVPVTTPFIPGPNKTIAKAELAKIPLFGLIYKRGSILVDRKDPSSRKDSFRKMKEVLQMGMHVCIYPEGTRNKTSLPLKDFHDGAFKLATDTGTPIIPSLLFHTREILPPGKTFFFRPGKMEIHFLTPIYVKKNDDYGLLKDKVHEIMSRYYQAHQN